MAYSTRIRYGLRLLANLANQGANRYVSIAEIAEEEGVSTKYLEQIVGLLRPLGILSSLRGARGGYALTCSPADVSLESVFETLGGLPAPVPCADTTEVCERISFCVTRPFWLEFDAHVRQYLRAQTLADLATDVALPDAGPLFSAFPPRGVGRCSGGRGALTPARTVRKQNVF